MTHHAHVAEILREAYQDELETVTNYLTLSVTLDGVAAEEVKERLAEEIDDELGHARSLASRLKELGERIPGSMDLNPRQQQLQPPAETTDLTSVVEGVVEAERTAIDTYRRLIHAARDADDPVSEDLGINILADEERHRTLFEGFLKDLQQQAGQQRELERAA